MSVPVELDGVEINVVGGGVTAPQGFRAAGIHTGVKRQKKDLSLVVSDRDCTCAGTYTTNRVKAAPLLLTKKHVDLNQTVRAIVANSGNANACNGPRGMADAVAMVEQTASVLGIAPEQVLVASTGVIGVPLALDKILPGIERASQALSPDGGADAALGIMTTDTVPKEVAVKCNGFTLGAMAKGSGMIHPNMATMLAFITTDASVGRPLLEAALKDAVAKSFNMISVDGDTSTNDMVLVLANGASGVSIEPNTPEEQKFRQALDYVCITLAKMIARDGEGATKLIEVRARGAKTVDDARLAVRAITTSQLVKTAIFGEDANWGRILCAAGYSGADLVLEHVRVELGDVLVFDQGMSVPFDEELAKQVLAQKDVTITVDLGAGDAEATGWTCDLTYEYVKINADYRT